MTGALAATLVQCGLDWIVPDWHGPAHVKALFTTRNGGAGSGAAATLDLGPARATTEELAGAIGENRHRLGGLLPADPAWLSQVHGTDVATIDLLSWRGVLAAPPTADAAVTRTRGIVITVRTADCLPVLLADRAGTVVAVAHAGWRGLAAGILEATVAAMRVNAHDVVAWIGPAIGPSAFEVGADVYTAYCASDAGAAMHFAPLRDGRQGKWLADLAGLARRRLAASGITDVAGGGYCTFTDTARFFSWRRDRQCGRMALVAWLD